MLKEKTEQPELMNLTSKSKDWTLKYLKKNLWMRKPRKHMTPFLKNKEKLLLKRNKLRKELWKKKLTFLPELPIMKMVPTWSSTKLLRNANAKFPSTSWNKEKQNPSEELNTSPVSKAKETPR